MFTENFFCKFWKTFFVYAIFFLKVTEKRKSWPGGGVMTRVELKIYAQK